MPLPNLVEYETITADTPFDPEAVFRFTTFAGARDGHGLDGALLWCTVEGFDWYAPLFNSIVIANTTFRDVVFRGASFRGCRLVECTFERCRFEQNNMGRGCTFDECSLTECRFIACESDRTSPVGRTVFTKNRWYGCTQTRCKGFEGLF